MNVTSLFLIIQQMLMINQGLNFQQCLDSFKLWMDSNPTMYQTILFYNISVNSHLLYNEVAKEVYQRFPSTKITSSKIIDLKIRSKTFFVILSSNKAFIIEVLYKIKDLRWTASVYRLLIVTIPNFNITEILIEAWKQFVVDIVVIQIPDYTISNKTLVYNYNPFTKKYLISNCSSNITWFPDNMKNLHGYPINIGILNDPPYSNVIRNSTGHVIIKSGADVNVLDILSNSMNFEQRFVTWIGNASFCYKNNSSLQKSGFHKELFKGRIDFLANPQLINLNAESRFLGSPFEYSQWIYFTDVCAVVPVIYESTNDAKILTIITGLSIVFIVVIIAKLFHFDPEPWKIHNIVLIMFGFTSLKRPKIFNARLVFLGLIVAASVYSFALFNGILNNAMEIESRVNFDSSEDLSKWNLVLYGDPCLVRSEDSNSGITKVKINPWKSREKCVNDMVKYKNTCCVMSRSKAIATISIRNSIRTKNDAKLMISDCLYWLPMSMRLRASSPYKRRIDKILQLLTQSGLDTKFVFDDIGTFVDREKSKEENQKLIKQLKLFHPPLVVMLHTYWICIFVFIMELTFDYLNRKYKIMKLIQNLRLFK